MYEGFYNFSSKPFRLSPDPRFLFNSRTHVRAMAYLRYGIQLGEGFVVITGDIGAGKTTLARAMMQTLAEEQHVVAAQLVSTNIESDDMLRVVAAAFGIETEGAEKSTVLKNLEQFMRAQSEAGKRVLLVVDEVQNLPARSLEELRMLSNFQVGEKALLQSFLLGQEEFHKTIQSHGMEQFRQRIIAAHHLGPMDRDETEQYIMHRLRLVGWKDDPIFTAEAFDRIFEYGGGLPRKINALCDRVLLYGALEELHEISGEVVDTVKQEQDGELGRVGIQLAGDGETGEEPEPFFVEPAPVGRAPGGDEARLAALERRVAVLEEAIRKERERTKKLVLMAFLSNDDVELPDVLEMVRKVDEA